MSDHPDIEKLDPSVREIVREVFRDPANGTPDDISKAGCLALALKGKEAWNAWRERFPVVHVNSYGASSNYADFSDQKFSNYRLDFSGFNFDYGAVFSGTTFNIADFEGVRFGARADFFKSVFLNNANFRGAQFGLGLTFESAIFKRDAIFKGAQFNDWALFDKVEFFQLATFVGRSWEKVSRHYFDLDEAKKWATERSAHPSKFQSISFHGAIFKNDADFSGREFLGTTRFNEAQFRRLPLFHACELYQDTDFEGAEFPSASGNASTARAYRTLKLAFSQQQATREEQRFFKLEMEEEALRATGVQKWLYWAYKTFSDFGFSVTQPLKYAAYALLVFIGIYGVLSAIGQCILASTGCQFSPAWFEFSVLQAIPLLGMDKASDVLRPAVFSSNEYLSVVVTLFVVLHKTISLAALFLAGLALRNLFKLK